MPVRSRAAVDAREVPNNGNVRVPRHQGQRKDDWRLGRMVLDRRTKLGWSQTELAQRVIDNGMPCTLNVVSAVENGKRSVTVYEAAHLAFALGYPLETILDGIQLGGQERGMRIAERG